MRYILQHIKNIIDTYNGRIPLAHFLKTYFKQYPILGSRDRKILATMAYSWYRCAKGIASTETEVKIKKCLSLCNHELPKGVIFPAMPEHYQDDILFDINKLFPFDVAFSQGISKEEWVTSMLTQPDFFIRILKDKEKVIGLLDGANIPFTFLTDNCLALPNGTKTDALLPPDSYMVQDASSQYTGNYFSPKKNESWYDCCSGGGGKSLLLKSIEPHVRLTVSDNRESVLHNLKQRFRQYHYSLPAVHITDAANSEQLNKTVGNEQYDNIICDVPCSGSGTWARTPEQLYFFDTATLPEFSVLQKKIAVNVSRHLKPGGRLIYITCSVFKNENEDVVNHLIKETGLQLMQSALINGISSHADSMFVGVVTATLP